MFICCINLSKHSCINFSERYRGSMIGLAGVLNATVSLCRRKYFAQAARLLFQASGFLFPLSPHLALKIALDILKYLVPMAPPEGGGSIALR